MMSAPKIVDTRDLDGRGPRVLAGREVLIFGTNSRGCLEVSLATCLLGVKAGFTDFVEPLHARIGEDNMKVVYKVARAKSEPTSTPLDLRF